MEAEVYHLPVLFTNEERKRYAEWGIKKEKWLLPFAVVTIVVDIFVTLETVCLLWDARSEVAYFSSWLRLYGDAAMYASYFAALVLTFLILKPLDLILDWIYRKPVEPRMLHLSPESDGVRWTLTRNDELLAEGLMTWEEWRSAVVFQTNELYARGECLQIGQNTIESIYPKEKQKKWMDRPEEKVTGVIQLKTISQNFEGYLASLEEKKKEAEWESRQTMR